MLNLPASELDRRILWFQRKGERTLKHSLNNELDMVSVHHSMTVVFCKRSRWGTQGLRFGAIFAGVLVAVACMVQAGDWPQILGPNRDGRAAPGESLPDSITAKGPVVAWSESIGSGYAGPIVSGESVYLFHRRGEDELVSCWAKVDGKLRWETKLIAEYRGGIDSDTGPRCVPCLVGQDLVVYGAAGQLSCLNPVDGKVRWSISLRKDFKADDGYFGAGSTPLVLEDRIIVNVGSRQAGVVAVARSDGKVLWKSTSYEASYSSPVALQYQGKPLVLIETRLNLVGLRPENGEVAFELPFGMRGPTVNAATPIGLPGNKWFLTASYGIGACLIDLNSSPPKVIYRNDELLASQYVTPVAIGNFVYAINGREDMGGGEVCCLDPLTEKVKWSDGSIGIAHLIAAGNRVLAVSTTGEVSIFEADPESFKKLASFQLPQATYRAMPALAAGRLWVRSNDGRGGGKLLAIELK